MQTHYVLVIVACLEIDCMQLNMMRTQGKGIEKESQEAVPLGACVLPAHSMGRAGKAEHWNISYEMVCASTHAHTHTHPHFPHGDIEFFSKLLQVLNTCPNCMAWFAAISP